MSKSRSTVGRRIVWRIEAAAYDALTFVVRLLPLDAASWLGGAIVRVLGPMTGVSRIVERNLRLAFPALGEAERRRLAAAQWDNVGRYFVELVMIDRLALASGRIEIEGEERLRDIARRQAPTVFVSGHFSNIEVMAAAILGCGVNCLVTGRRLNNPYMDERLLNARRSYGMTMFAPKGSDGAREMLAALHRGQSIAVLNDQKNNLGVAAPFFGHLAHTASGATKIALRTTGTLQPMSVRRLKGARFRVTAHEPIVLQRTGDRQADLEAGIGQINAFVETRVRERPEEWFWVHKRWSDAAYKALDEGAG
jgi:KDO2-lipid IV(A) lauroyltransferase